VMAANRFVKAGGVRSPGYVEKLNASASNNHPITPKANNYDRYLMKGKSSSERGVMKSSSPASSQTNAVVAAESSKQLWVGTPVGSDPSGLVAHLKLANATLELEVCACIL